MDEDKVYYPEVTPTTPFPGENAVVENTTTANSGTLSPTTIKPNPLPVKRVAVELLSSALNTRSKKVLAEFQFTESGALQIGKYSNGISGDLRISPNGIVARDLAGITTFAIDGTTGDAIFKGTVQAGSFISSSLISSSVISGDITVGGNGNTNGFISVLDSSDVEKVRLDNTGILVNTGKLTIKDGTDATIVDATGLVSTASFPTGQTGSLDVSTSTTTSTTLVDMPNTTLSSFSISRTRGVIVLLTCMLATAADTGVEAYIFIGGDVNDVQEVRIRLLNVSGVTWRSTTYMTYNLRQLTANTPPTSYTIKARWLSLGGGSVEVANRQITYMLFGI